MFAVLPFITALHLEIENYVPISFLNLDILLLVTV